MSRHRRLLPQIIVIVTMDDSTQPSQPQYTYYDPMATPTGSAVWSFFADSCSLKSPAPYDTIFVLDYASTLAGWYFRKNVEPVRTSPKIPHWRSANRLSMTTRYKTAVSLEYSFYLCFKNRLTNALVNDDPQESNVPPVKTDGDTVLPTKSKNKVTASMIKKR